MLKISIASTFYNDKKMLKVVLDSVLSQTYPDIEHCIADAGSTDGSVELLQEYEEKYRQAGKTLRWTSGKDTGRSDGINKSVDMATGDYIFVAFFDPFINERIVDEVASTLNRENPDYIYGGIYYHRDGTIVRKWDGKKGNWKLGWMAATPTLCVKRSVWELKRPFDPEIVLAADYGFQLALFEDERLKGVPLNKKIVLYYAGGGSNNKLEDKVASIKEAYKVLKRRQIKHAWFINLCKTVRGVCSYIFVVRQRIEQEDLK